MKVRIMRVTIERSNGDRKHVSPKNDVIESEFIEKYRNTMKEEEGDKVSMTYEELGY